MADIDKGLPNTRTELEVPGAGTRSRCCGTNRTTTSRSNTRRRWWCNY